jgi:hypothetical protein
MTKRPPQFSETQAIKHRAAMREAAERQARYMATILVIEIVGFAATIIIELLK